MRWTSFLVLSLVVLSSRSHATISTIVVSGGDAVEIAGAKFDSFTLASLNSSGHAAFVATLQEAVGGVSTTNDQVLYTFEGGLSLKAREGSGGVPAIADANFSDLVDVAISDSGDVLARATLAIGPGDVTSSSNQGLWRFLTGGNQLLARTGVGDAPGVAGGQFKKIPNFIRTTENGDSAFSDQLVSGGTITLANDIGIWFYQGSTGSLIVREEVSQVPGIPSATFSTLGIPSINNNAQGTARATLKHDATLGIDSSNHVGVWKYTGSSGELIARQAVGNAPETGNPFSSFGHPVINETGQVAFRAELTSGSGGLWRYTTSVGELVALANTDTVPEVPNASFSTFDEPRFADNGALLVHAELNSGPGGVNNGNNSGIWRFTSSGNHLLARTGSGGVPGLPGANFSELGAYTANANGSAVIAATLEMGPGGVGSDDSGIWLYPATGIPELIARKGDQLAGRIVAGLSLLSNDLFGRPVRGFNNQNQLLFHAEFTNGDEGLFLFTPGGGSGADFNGDTFVDATDLSTWQSAYESTTAGDADGDGDSDGADFLAWQRQFTGSSAAASNLSVPEPAGIYLALAFLGLLVPRRVSG